MPRLTDLDRTKCVLCEPDQPWLRLSICDGCMNAVWRQMSQRHCMDKRWLAFKRALAEQPTVVQAALRLLETLSPLEQIAEQAE